MQIRKRKIARVTDPQLQSEIPRALSGAMNFILRTTQPVAPELPSVHEVEPQKNAQSISKPVTTLEGLIAEDPYPNYPTSDDIEKDNEGIGSGNALAADAGLKNHISIGNHSDVTEDEGWIMIPREELPDGWSDAPSIHELLSLDRSCIFPGEQLHILVCLSASKQDSEIITPFKVAAVMTKNGRSAQNGKQKMKTSENKTYSESVQEDANGLHGETTEQGIEENGRTMSTNEDSPRPDITATETFLRMEDHKHQTETLLARFRNSNFFVRIAGSDEPLWSKRSKLESSSLSSEISEGRSQLNDSGTRKISKGNLQSAVIDRGSFDAIASGGIARDNIKCYSLSNGDIVVLLQINVGISDVKHPVLEVLQFEKYQGSDLTSEGPDYSLASNLGDPCRELLSWLLPIDRSLPPPRPLSPPLGSTPGLGAVHQRSSSSGSQLFSFSHFRSYSMPSLPQVAGPPSPAIPPSPKPDFDLEDLDRFSPEKPIRSHDIGNEGLLSFRGVSLEPERFSVHCGLEGIFLPGRRWRRKLEIVQPIEISSFAAECATEDLLCVQVKNISPAHLPDLVIFLDSITIVFEEASKAGPSLSLPIASIETGNAHSLPNLALRRGEEHSFVLRPATTIVKDFKAHGVASALPPHPKIGAAAATFAHQSSRVGEGIQSSSSDDRFAVLVSCRSNYSESKLFFKQPTSWRPRVARDLVISVSSETKEQTCGPIGRVPQLPVQVLTLQASNLTSEDLTLIVNAPISSTCPPSVVPLNSAPTSPMSSFGGFSEFVTRVGGDKWVVTTQRLSSMPTMLENQKENTSGGKRSISLGQHMRTTSDVISSSGLGCTHLWLQSKVPLGCVPAHSSATVKLELLPLTDGIITLDSLQVAVKEKGLTYVPEQPLKVYATSSIATGFV
ncbi:hypothetical protein J5N97_009963 [Dioscorea zingiberensis]|uniref:Uncharacterized protein n=1 Tax=Dioscorea zingiberensis TaxID=325984 RepID=A0A9D5HMB7_9LILI|nr:hypothetical protein J5N97_009963 [Dioscorea zingiberensis]